MSTVKRRLEDLYVVGKELTFDDGNGASVVVWLQKLNPVELSASLRRANAARARVRTVKSDPHSDEYQEYWLEVLDFEEKDNLVDYLAGERTVRAQEREEARLAAEDYWANEGYLQGLRDAWDEELSERHLLAPDAESERVRSELTRFADAATEAAEEDVKAVRLEYRAKDLADLRDEAMDRVLAYHANAAWLDEFHRCELWKGVRHPNDRRAYYFTDRSQVDTLSAMVLNRLTTEYAELSVDVVEGKDSEETPNSSNSSDSLDEAETEASSGLVAVGQ